MKLDKKVYRSAWLFFIFCITFFSHEIAGTTFSTSTKNTLLKDHKKKVKSSHKILKKGGKKIDFGLLVIKMAKQSPDLTQEEKEFFKAHAQKKHVLRFSKNNAYRVTDKTLKVFDEFKELAFEVVDFTNCRKITDTGLEAFIGKCPQLKSLLLNKCAGLTSKTFENLKQCSWLSVLTFSECLGKGLSYEILDELLTACKNLGYIHCDECSNVCLGLGAIISLQGKYQKLTILGLDNNKDCLCIIL